MTWDASRQQTGCFLATLIAVSAGVMTRAYYRRILYETDSAIAASARAEGQVFIGAAVLLVLLGVAAYFLKRWTLIAYFIVASATVAYAFAGHGAWYMSIPLLIGMITVAGVWFGRRHHF